MAPRSRQLHIRSCLPASALRRSPGTLWPVSSDHRMPATYVCEVPQHKDLGLAKESRKSKYSNPNLAVTGHGHPSPTQGSCPGTQLLAYTLKGVCCQQPSPLLSHGGKRVQREGSQAGHSPLLTHSAPRLSPRPHL